MDRISAPNAPAPERALRAAADRGERARPAIGRIAVPVLRDSRPAPSAGQNFRRRRARPCRSWPSAPDGTMTIEDCERASEMLSPVARRRGPGRAPPTASKFRLPASTARWCASPISAARWVTRSASRWPWPVGGDKRFRGLVRGSVDLEGRRAVLAADQARRGKDRGRGRVDADRRNGRGAARAYRRSDSRDAAP